MAEKTKIVRVLVDIQLAGVVYGVNTPLKLQAGLVAVLEASGAVDSNPAAVAYVVDTLRLPVVDLTSVAIEPVADVAATDAGASVADVPATDSAPAEEPTK